MNDKTFAEEMKEWGNLLNAKYDDVCLGMIDILGFSKFLDKECKCSPTKLTKIIISEIIKEKFLIETEKYPSFNSLKLKLLSDTFIVYTKEITPVSLLNVITILENIRIGLIENGLFSRGAIVQGKHFIKDDYMISPAFVEAHKIEREICVYPRIIIDNSLADMIKSEYKKEGGANGIYDGKIFRPISKETISKEFDGCYVMHPFLDIDAFSNYINNSIDSLQGAHIQGSCKDIPEDVCDAIERIRDGILCGKKRACDKIEHIVKAVYFINEFNNFINNFRIREEKKHVLKIDF